MNGPTVAVLVVLTGVIFWLAVEVRRAIVMLEPLANSNIVQGLAAI